MVMAIGYSFTNYILGPGFIKLKLFSDHRELLNKRSEISGICKRLMKEALEKKVEDTLILEILRHAGKEKDHAYTPDEIMSEFLNLFTMAADTTATVLGLTVYYLDKNQGCLKKLIAEIKKMGKKVSELTKEDLDSMDYLTAVLKETLRLASPYSAMLNRVATKDHYLGEVKITKNTLLTVYPGVLHSLETVFDQPDEFNPSRWLNK
jgi:cytochrome P450